MVVVVIPPLLCDSFLPIQLFFSMGGYVGNFFARRQQPFQSIKHRRTAVPIIPENYIVASDRLASLILHILFAFAGKLVLTS